MIKCEQIDANNEGFNYSSCKILSSGNFYIFIQDHSYLNISLNISAGIKEVLTIMNKSSFAVGELFEAKPIILGEDNITITNDTIIEIMNPELIGLKKIICRYKNCSFYLSCLEAKSIVISYKLSNSQTFNSTSIECKYPADNYITFNEISNKVTNI